MTSRVFARDIGALAAVMRTGHLACVALHLIKLCVGIDRVEQLTAEGRAMRGRGGRFVVNTRMTPKRADELVDGGSLFWVIKGSVLCRQTILDISTIGEGPASRCEIELDPEVVRTASLARRPFQGWRYLAAGEAPFDLTSAEAGDMPDDLVRDLRELGAW